MTDTLTNESLKKTLGLAVSVIATEHFMSAGLNGLYTETNMSYRPHGVLPSSLYQTRINSRCGTILMKP
jgi:hypothetical protein